MLNYTDAPAPNDIKGEIVEDSYKVSLREFCEALKIQLWVVSRLFEDLLEKVYGKNFSFSKVVLSN